jgi:hypothetical protein
MSGLPNNSRAVSVDIRKIEHGKIAEHWDVESRPVRPESRFNVLRQTQATEVRMESTISTKDLKAKLDRKESIKVVETLAPERYREAHLPGALNIPPDKIKELAPQVLPNKNAEIVTYCTNTH